jgi:hypothetical protein
MHGGGTAMTGLILKRASSSRPSSERRDDDYDVLADGVVVGRIMHVGAGAPKDAPWFWGLRLWPPPGPHADARLRADARGRDGRVRQELETRMMIKTPLPESVALLEKVHECLGPNRLPLLIAIDGADGVGKSSLASWLAWQLGAPAVYLDLYVIRESNPLRWRTDELRRIVNRRLVDHAAPLVVEGIMVLAALDAIDRKPNFLIYLEGKGGNGLSRRLAAYRARYQPEQHADFRLQGVAE